MTAPKALVAGASGGIGNAIAAALARDGHDLILTYRSNRRGAEAAAERVREIGREASVCHIELTDVDGTSEVIESQPRLNAVIYAAGPYIPMRHVSALSGKTYAEQLLGDAGACFNLLQPSIPRLRETSGCVVALTTAALGRYATRDLLSAAPKAAIHQIVRALAIEEGRFGVRANSVGVGLIDAGMLNELRRTGDYDEATIDAAVRQIPLRRLGTAEDIAEAVAFLVSERAAWISGQLLHVDGGYVA